MLIRFLLMWIIAEIINKANSQVTKLIPKELNNMTTGPLQAVGYKNNTALIMVKGKTFIVTIDGNVTPYAISPNAQSGYNSAKFYSLKNGYIAAICSTNFITIFNIEGKEIATNSAFTDYNVNPFNLTYPCFMNEIEENKFLVLSIDANRRITMHSISFIQPSSLITNWRHIIIDTQSKPIECRDNYSIKYITDELIIFTYSENKYPTSSFNIIGINKDAKQVQPLITLAPNNLGTILNFNKTCILIVSTQMYSANFIPITFNTLVYEENKIELKDTRTIDVGLTKIQSFEVAQVQNNAIEVLCLTDYGISIGQYEYNTRKYKKTIISYSIPSYYPNIAILPNKSIMLFYKISGGNVYFIYLNQRCEDKEYDFRIIDVLLTEFIKVYVQSITFYDMSTDEFSPSLIKTNGVAIPIQNNQPYILNDYVSISFLKGIKSTKRVYTYSNDQTSDFLCTIIFNGCNSPCATCNINNEFKCNSCIIDYYLIGDSCFKCAELSPSCGIANVDLASYEKCKKYKENCNPMPICSNSIFYHPIEMKCLTACGANTHYYNEDKVNVILAGCYTNCNVLLKKNDILTKKCVNHCPGGTIFNTLSSNCDIPPCNACDRDFTCFPTPSYNIYAYSVNICSDECKWKGYYFHEQTPCDITCNQTLCCPVCKQLNSINDIDNNDINTIPPSIIHNGNISYVFYNSSSPKEDYPQNMSKLILQEESKKILRKVYEMNEEDDFIITIENTLNASRLTYNFKYFIYKSNGTKCDISLCNITDKSKIFIKLPMNITHKDYEKAKYYNDKGIDIFNPNHPFFTDKCYPFTSENNTDISLKDRNKDILINPDSICEPDCNYISTDFNTNEVTCECTQSKKIIFNEFKSALLESNSEVVLCYKLVFTLNIFTKGNIGHYYGMVLIIILLINDLIFGFSNISRLNTMINKLYDSIILNTQKRKSNKQVNVQSKTVKQLSKSMKQSNAQSKVSAIIIFKDNSISKSNAVKDVPSNTSSNDKIEAKNDLDNVYKDERINNLSYEEALINDKRSFLQIVWSYIKSTQSIIYLFIKSETTLNTIKIALFIFSLLLDFALNALFYTDKYISKAYTRQKGNSIIDTLPISIYSFFFGFVINLFLKYLSSFEYIYEICKGEKNPQKLLKVSKRLIRRYTIQLSFFFFLSLVLSCGLWYYMTAFCGVYINSQDEWFFSGLTSFGISMIIPFVLSFLIACLRYYSLIKKSSCCFKVIKLISIFI